MSYLQPLYDQVDQLAQDRVDRNARIRELEDALRDARPYVFNQTHNTDWRGETARDILGKVDAALKPAAQGPIGTVGNLTPPERREK